MIKPSSQSRRHRGLTIIAAACAGLTLFLFNLPQWLTLDRNENGIGVHLLERYPSLLAFDRAEETATDLFQYYGRKARLDPRIVFLAIDTPSFDQSGYTEQERLHPTLLKMRGGFPFPRTVYPSVIRKLAQAGAKAIMFDIMFPGPKDGDDDFREALETYRDKVVIGSNLQIGVQVNGGSTGVITTPSPSLIPEDDRLFDSRVGFVNFKPDYEVVRRAQYRANILEYFGEKPEALGEDSDSGQRELLSLTAQGAKKAGLASQIPDGTVRLPFRFLGDVQQHSLSDIFVPTLWERNFADGKFFKDKLVFIGPYGNWSKDELQTPFGRLLGPEIHLGALNALVKNEYLQYSSRAMDALFIVGAAVIAIVAGLAVADPIRRSITLPVVVLLYVVCAFLVYNYHGLVLSVLSPSVTLLSGGFIGLVWERRLEQQEKARVRSTLERYVSRDVVKEVLDNPQSFLNTAGGMRKPVTVLFSDIRNFTTMTESADPAKFVEQLNEYFSEMVRIVFANRGTLDKFIGDAVMAHWGSIVSRGEGPDACRAVSAALDMQRAMPKLNARWKERGMFELNIGVGVNHGDAICANIGSFEKQEVTAIGDTVNLASRLEGATKTFRQDLLIGEKVATLVTERFVLRPVDLLQVKGKSKPVEVFAVLGDRQSTELPGWMADYVEGIRLFRAQNFAEAHRKFDRVLAEHPEDFLSEEYQRRCHDYEVNPPGEGWDGSYVMTQK